MPFPSLTNAFLVAKATFEALVASASPSPDAGNLIQQRANGLYAALAAPTNVSNLFLDSVNGDDNNPGTMAQPLKTLARAAYLINTLGTGVGNYTVNLKASQTYTTTGVGNRLAFNGDRIAFRVWGEPKYTNSSNFGTYYPTCAIDFQRATINLGVYDIGDGSLQDAGISSSGSVYFEGIILNGPTTHQYGGSEMIICPGGSSISMFGCDINIGRHVFVTNGINLDACVINFQNTGAQSFLTTSGCRGPIVVNGDSVYSANSAAKQYPGEAAPRPAYTGRTMHMRDRITRTNFSDGQDWTHDPVTYGAVVNYYIAS